MNGWQGWLEWQTFLQDSENTVEFWGAKTTISHLHTNKPLACEKVLFLLTGDTCYSQEPLTETWFYGQMRQK